MLRFCTVLILFIVKFCHGFEQASNQTDREYNNDLQTSKHDFDVDKRDVAMKDLLSKKDRSLIKSARGEEELKTSLNLKNEEFSGNLKKKKKKKSLIPTDRKDIVSIELDKNKVKKFRLRPSSKRRCTRDITTRCGGICRCIKGKLYCCRQRRDWDTLTTADKRKYVRTVYDIAMGRRGWSLRNRYNRLLYIHERYWFSGIHRKNQFFPWHRIYLLMYENILRSADCTITVPYWDWTKKVNRWWENDVFGEDYMGSNVNWRTGRYVDYDSCPATGAFSERSGFTDLRGSCLIRKFTYSISPASYRRIQNILSWPDFNKFETALRHEHGLPHYIIGGQGSGLFFTERAAEDPIFFLHHSNVDYQWYQRQTRYIDLRNQFWGERPQRNYPLTGLGATVADAVNPFRHGRDNIKTCVEYIELDDRRYERLVSEQDDVGQLSMECEQGRHRFPEQIFTLFRTSSEDISEFMNSRNNNGYC